MEELTPLGKVFHAGTLAGNPIATAAGLAALNELTGDVYTELMARARQLAGVLRDACAAAGLTAQFPVVGTLVGAYLAAGDPPVNFEQAKQTSEAAYAALFQGALRARLALAPGAYEAIFVGLGHDDAVLDDIAIAAHAAAATAVETLGTA
jgi:glutamate-1-semialdehyde 2,1-aminomutase